MVKDDFALFAFIMIESVPGRFSVDEERKLFSIGNLFYPLDEFFFVHMLLYFKR